MVVAWLDGAIGLTVPGVMLQDTVLWPDRVVAVALALPLSPTTMVLAATWSSLQATPSTLMLAKMSLQPSAASGCASTGAASTLVILVAPPASKLHALASVPKTISAHAQGHRMGRNINWPSNPVDPLRA